MSDSLIVAYHLDVPHCHSITSSSPQTKKCKCNPNCLHGLKKKCGIWEDNQKVLKASLKLIWTQQNRSQNQSIYHPINRSTLFPDAINQSLNQPSNPFFESPECKYRTRNKYVGLTNLGATCYMNALLQCLFMNKYFRHTLYLFRSSHQPENQHRIRGSESIKQSINPFDPNHPDLIIHQLQMLFGLMEFGPQSVLDQSIELIARSLGLNKYEQQDINEFNHLFLSLLDERLKNHSSVDQSVNQSARQSAIKQSNDQSSDQTNKQSNDISHNHLNHTHQNNQTFHLAPSQSDSQSNRSINQTNQSINRSQNKSVDESVRTLIQDEFMGETISVVTCQSCRYASKQKSSFLDLSLQIKGKARLIDCLDDLIKIEDLYAANQYYCSQCQQKRDAIKQSRITILPSVLNVQLIRFDWKLDNRVKLNDRVYIPYTLDMTPFLYDQPDSQPDNQSINPSENQSDNQSNSHYIYQLTAILRHKGTSAHRGHYTAEIVDENLDWWIFDDEKVTRKINQSSNKPLATSDQQSTNQSKNQSSAQTGSPSNEQLSDESSKSPDWIDEANNQPINQSSKKAKKRRKPPLTSASKRQRPNNQSNNQSARKAKTEEINLDSDGDDQFTFQPSNQDDVDTDCSIQSIEQPVNQSREKATDQFGEYSSNAYMLVYTIQSRLHGKSRMNHQTAIHSAIKPVRPDTLSTDKSSSNQTNIQSKKQSQDLADTHSSSFTSRSHSPSANQSTGLLSNGSTSLSSIKQPNYRSHTELSNEQPVDNAEDDVERLSVPILADPFGSIHDHSSNQSISQSHSVNQTNKQSSKRKIELVEISPEPSPVRPSTTHPVQQSKLRLKKYSNNQSNTISSQSNKNQPHHQPVSRVDSRGFTDCYIGEDDTIVPESPPPDRSVGYSDNHSIEQSTHNIDASINPWADLGSSQSNSQLIVHPSDSTTQTNKHSDNISSNHSAEQPHNSHQLYNTSQSSLEDDSYVHQYLKQSTNHINNQSLNQLPNSSIAKSTDHALKEEKYITDGGSVDRLLNNSTQHTSKPLDEITAHTIRPPLEHSAHQSRDVPIKEIKLDLMDSTLVQPVKSDKSVDQLAHQAQQQLVDTCQSHNTPVTPQPIKQTDDNDHFSSLDVSYHLDESLDPLFKQSVEQAIKEWMQCDYPRCQPPSFVNQSVNFKLVEMLREKKLYADYEDRINQSIDRRKNEVDFFVDIEAGYQASNQSIDEIIDETHQLNNQSSNPYCFIHAAFLQRWLSGLSPADLPDESIASSTDHSIKQAIQQSNNQSDPISLVEDEDPEMTAALKASAEESNNQSNNSSDDTINIDSDLEADLEKSVQESSNQFEDPSPAQTSIQSEGLLVTHSNTQSNSQSNNKQFIPLWPGDIFESLSKLRCPHDRLDPSVTHLVKRISRTGWDLIVESLDVLEKEWSSNTYDSQSVSYSGIREPLTESNSFCSECTKKVHSINQSIKQHRDQYSQLAESMKSFTKKGAANHQSNNQSIDLSDDQLADNWSAYLVSKAWWRVLADSVKQMKLKTNQSLKWTPVVSPNVNSDLVCKHGNMKLEAISQSHHVDEQMWVLFMSLYPESRAFRSTELPCEQCVAQEEDDDKKQQQIKQEIIESMTKYPCLKHFMKLKHDTFPDERFTPIIKKYRSSNQSSAHLNNQNKIYLLPTSWVKNQFMPYFEQSLGPIINPPEQVKVRQFLLCTPHNCLIYNPRPINQSNDASNGQSSDISLDLPGIEPGLVTYCDPTTWSALVDLKYVDPDDSVCVQIDHANNQSAGGDTDWSNLVFTITPPLCWDCINQTITQSNDQKYSYSNETGYLNIHRVELDTSLEQFKQANSQPINPTVTSSRSRRARRVGTLEDFEASGMNASDPISLVKMKLSQWCAHNPSSMLLYYQGKELLDQKTLKYYQVVDGADIYMKVDTSRSMDSEEYDEMIGAFETSNKQSDGPESGFKGTMLSGNRQSNNQSNNQSRNKTKRSTSVNLIDSPPLLPQMMEE